MTTARHAPWADRAIALAAFVATVLFVLAMPRNLGQSDESYYLYHARRMLEGEVLYRDVFDYTTPLFVDLTAALFRMFGTTIVVARAWAAVIHGGITVLVYAACRVLGVRRALALAAAATHVAVDHPAWPIASPHWLATLCTLLLLVQVLRGRAGGWLADAISGMLAGAVIVVQQQKGVPMLLALLGVVAARSLIDRRYRTIVERPLVARVGAVLGGAVAVAGTVLLTHVAFAGVAPVVHQLVVYPLAGYRRYNVGGVAWGSTLNLSLHLAPNTFPWLLKYAPIVMVPLAIEAVLRWGARRGRAELTGLVTLLAFGVGAIVSVLYFPDFIHLAFIAPIMLVGAARAVERSLVLARGAGDVAATGLALVVLLGCAMHMRQTLVRARAAFPFIRDTSFGSVAFQTDAEATFTGRMRELVRRSADKRLFCYPVFASLYLTTGARNPTPHEIAMPIYQDDGELLRIVETLERTQVSYVVVIPQLAARDGDPVLTYVRSHYDCSPVGSCMLCVRSPAPRS